MKRILPLLISLFALSPLATNAAESEFGCAALLDDLGFWEEGQASIDQVALRAPNGIAGVNPMDPVNVRELLDESDPKQLRPVLLRGTPIPLSDRASGDPKFLHCVLITVEFLVNSSSVPLSVAAGITNESAKILPLLLLAESSDSTLDEHKDFKEWGDTKDFQIPFQMERADSDLLGEVTSSVPVVKKHFSTIRFFGPANKPIGIETYDASETPVDNAAVQALIGGEEVLKKVLVLCGLDCSDLRGMYTPPPPPLDLQVAFTFVKGNEDKGGESFERLVGNNTDPANTLGCLLSVLFEEARFVKEPDCEKEVADNARTTINPTLDISGPSLIRVIHDSAPAKQLQEQVEPKKTLRKPSKLIVELPPGVSGAQCVMRWQTAKMDAPQDLERDKYPRAGDPARFKAYLDSSDLDVVEGAVSFTLIPDTPAACGGPKRKVTMQVERDLTVGLLPDPPPADWRRHGIAYVTLFDKDALKDLSLGRPSERQAMSISVFAALQGAHAAAAEDMNTNTRWPLVSARFDYVDDDRLKEIGDLDSDDLRQGGGNKFRDFDSEIERSAEQSLRTGSHDLIYALKPLIEDFQEEGILTDLTISLLGWVSRSTSGVSAEPCSDIRFADLAEELERVEGLDIILRVLPILERPENTAELAAQLRPIKPTDRPVTELAGGYRCLDALAGAEIMPFVVEPWRSPGEIPSLYGNFVSERSRAVLSDILADGEPR